ncbi:MAG: hypothetical protein ACRC5H_05465, partial [Treponemataceae bacterium]
EKTTNNYIYAIPEKQENYGVDIKINSEGNFVVKNGDFDTVGGKNNLLQSLVLRLTTASTKRIRLSSYGIRTSIGDTMKLENYLVSSIEQTIISDPRIKSIENISFKTVQDALYVFINYIDLNGEVDTFEGVIDGKN